MERTWIVAAALLVSLSAAQYSPPVYQLGAIFVAASTVAPCRILLRSPHFSVPSVPRTPGRTAVCTLIPATGSTVSGKIQLYQPSENAPVEITGLVQGLTPPGKHGFHMHRDGTTDDDCKGAGPHFNPYNQTHGGPKDKVRHAGDFGNICADSYGNAPIRKRDSHISLYPGLTYGVGHAIVVHAGTDDLGRGGNEESKKTGNAGGRLACCVVQTA